MSLLRYQWTIYLFNYLTSVLCTEHSKKEWFSPRKSLEKNERNMVLCRIFLLHIFFSDFYTFFSNKMLKYMMFFITCEVAWIIDVQKSFDDKGKWSTTWHVDSVSLWPTEQWLSSFSYFYDVLKSRCFFSIRTSSAIQ